MTRKPFSYSFFLYSLYYKLKSNSAVYLSIYNGFTAKTKLHFNEIWHGDAWFPEEVHRLLLHEGRSRGQKLV